MTITSQLTPQRQQSMCQSGIWKNKLLTDYLDDAAFKNGTSIAIVDHNSESGLTNQITYSELAKTSVRISCALFALGIRAGDVVAVQLPNWWHYAAIHLACLRIGAVINPLMPIFRQRELEFMLAFAEAKIFIVPEFFRGFEHETLALSLKEKISTLEHIFVVDGKDEDTSFEKYFTDQSWEEKSDLFESVRNSRPSPDDVIEIMYTSGTTGTPKGVMHTSNTLLSKAELARQLFTLKSSDTIFMGSPLAHQTGFMYAIVLSVFNASKCVLQDIWDPSQALHVINEQGCTITLGSTPFLSDLVVEGKEKVNATCPLRLFLCAGAPIPRVLVEQAAKAYPSMYVMSAWGMTEMGIATATYPGDSDEKVIGTDGRALPFQEVRILDSADKVAPHGQEGRLQARCVTSFVGYLKRPTEYGVDEGFWLETGDNARMDEDGYIRITGRSKDLIIRGGENIPVVEVEQLLYRHDAVADVAIVGMPDERLGERSCAFVSFTEGETLSFKGLVDYLKSCDITTQYLPERLEIIDTFPRTMSGKIQKFRLREMAQSLTPQSNND